VTGTQKSKVVEADQELTGLYNSGMKSRRKKVGKRLYNTARDVLSDIPPPAIARRLKVKPKVSNVAGTVFRNRSAAVRYIVEPKSRGFDVVDTGAVPRADGVWCYCVDLERAEFIAKLLNEFRV